MREDFKQSKECAKRGKDKTGEMVSYNDMQNEICVLIFLQKTDLQLNFS